MRLDTGAGTPGTWPANCASCVSKAAANCVGVAAVAGSRRTTGAARPRSRLRA